MKAADSVTLVPYVHGKLAFARYVRDCAAGEFDCIAVDLPSASKRNCLTRRRSAVISR